MQKKQAITKKLTIEKRQKKTNMLEIKQIGKE
jgi:hypothetical protein